MAEEEAATRINATARGGIIRARMGNCEHSPTHPNKHSHTHSTFSHPVAH